MSVSMHTCLQERGHMCTGAVYACIKEQVGVCMGVIAHTQTRDFLPLCVCMSTANKKYLCICKEVCVCTYTSVTLLHEGTCVCAHTGAQERESMFPAASQERSLH